MVITAPSTAAKTFLVPLCEMLDPSNDPPQVGKPLFRNLSIKNYITSVTDLTATFVLVQLASTWGRHAPPNSNAPLFLVWKERKKCRNT